MRLLRIFYLVALVVSLSLACVFYYQYQLKDKELLQYRSLRQLSGRTFAEANAELAQTTEKLERSFLELEQSQEELERSSQEIEKLNKIISTLEEDNLTFKGELLALKEEREKMQTKVGGLIKEKTVLEEKLFSLVQKFHSLRELKKAIKSARIEKRHKDRMEAIRKRLAKIETLKTLDEAALREGNRGYLVKWGETTFKPTTIRVELEPIGKW